VHWSLQSIEVCALPTSKKKNDKKLPTVQSYRVRQLCNFVVVGCYYIMGKSKGSPYSITERRIPELVPVLGSQPAGDVSHKPGCRLPLLSARPAVTPATLKRAATNFAAW